MATPSSVAIYARISQDRSGDELGVKRQLADCRAEAERRGWPVGLEYVDDDVSAYSGKRRPAYEAMLTDLKEGRRDAVVVWHMDRLHRNSMELERFIEVCDRARVRDVVSPSGDFDVANGDGLLVARMLVAVASNESYSKRRRGQRKALEIAQSGKPQRGGPRPFGFEPDHETHRLSEATVIRDCAARALAGETLISLATSLQDSGVKTVGGGEWRTNTLRNLLTNPRMWGMRVHQGQVIGPASWTPIITVDQGERLRRLLLDPARRTNRSARRYLLTGLLRCGLCGNTLNSAPKDGVRRYGCRMGPDARGCGGIFIYAEHLERFIARAVLHRLDSPALLTATSSGSTSPGETAALVDAIQKDADQLLTLAETWADGKVSKEEWLHVRDRVQGRLEGNRAAFARLTQRDAVADYLGHGAELQGRWDELVLSQQVAIVKAVLTHATIASAPVPGRHGLDPSRVLPVWRL
jgi:DNA invertase Pin-like site-specific DNA recombinase